MESNELPMDRRFYFAYSQLVVRKKILENDPKHLEMDDLQKVYRNETVFASALHEHELS